MSKFEKLGSFLLFEKIEEDKLSKNFLAGQIANNQIHQMQVVKKFDHSLSTLPDFILDLNQEFDILKQLANPNIIKPSSFVQEKSEFAAVFDYWEGKSLRSVLQKCSQEGYPFTADHSLLIGSRLCTALEYLHSKKVDDRRLVHGFICPETIFISYDGEIKLQYLGLAHALLKFAGGRYKLFHDYRNYMAPEVLSHQKVDRSSDIFGAGLVIYEMLTGEPYYAGGREAHAARILDNAQIQNNSGERIPLPEDVKKLLMSALAQDPAQRYASIGDMRKGLDQLLFSSEYSPNTFNLAFFMNSLFRENIEEENKNITQLKKIDVTSFVKEEPPPPLKPEHPVGAEAAKDVPAISLGTQSETIPSFGRSEALAEPKQKSKAPIAIIAAIAIAAIGTVGLMYFKSSTETSGQVAGLSPQQLKAQKEERVRLQQEAEKAQEEAKEKDEALKELQAKLDALMKQQEDAGKKISTAAPSQVVDTKAAIQRLQEEARRLEEEKRQQQILAEEKMRAAQAPAMQPASAQQPPPGEDKEESAEIPEEKTQQVASANPPSLTPASSQAQPITEQKTGQVPPAQSAAPPGEGQQTEMTPDVVKPVLVNRVNPIYPPAAAKKRVEGTVILSVLVSENGDVSDVKVLRPAGGTIGLNEAAVAAAKKWKFRPAVKDGKRISVWITYPIVFKYQ